MKFKIKRFDGKRSWFDIFDVAAKPHMSVLEALFQIQSEQDSSLSFRYSCRGAVCGSCAMLINKKHRLACRTQAARVYREHVISISPYGAFAKPEFKTGDYILVEPLPNLEVIKDLIVDMEPFFMHYESIKPGFENTEHIEGETRMSIENVIRVDEYAACILCGLCYGACPAAARDKNYIGPAALANAWRFYIDARYRSGDELLKRVDKKTGIWACDQVYRCVEVCPKQVPPTNAITGFIRKSIVHRMTHIFR